MGPLDLDSLTAGSLIEHLQEINQRLLSFNGTDLSEIGEAIEQRTKLVSRVGRLLRTAVLRTADNSGGAEACRAAFAEAVESGDVAVQRLLSLRQAISSEYQRVHRLEPPNAAEKRVVFYDM